MIPLDARVPSPSLLLAPEPWNKPIVYPTSPSPLSTRLPTKPSQSTMPLFDKGKHGHWHINNTPVHRRPLPMWPATCLTLKQVDGLLGSLPTCLYHTLPQIHRLPPPQCFLLAYPLSKPLPLPPPQHSFRLLDPSPPSSPNFSGVPHLNPKSKPPRSSI